MDIERVIAAMNSLENARSSALESLKVVDSLILELSKIREEAVKPVEPEVKLAEEPVEPEVKPVEPEVKPVEPEVKPVEPEVKPVEPEVKPVEPEVKPVEPEVKPIEPEVKPVEPEVKPVEPEVKPVEPEVEIVEEPVEPEEEPEEQEEEKKTPEIEPVELPDPILGSVRSLVAGVINVCCISLNWTDLKGPTSITNAGKILQDVYNNASRGLINMKVISKQVDVPFTHVSSNLYKAVDYAKEVVNKANKNKPYDIYVVYHSNIRTYSNANGGVAYCESTLIRTLLHEVGHLVPFGLQHANRLGVHYLDPTSFMGKFSTWQFNGPNLMYLGWIPKEEISIFDNNLTKTREYKIERLYKTKLENGISVVNVPGTVGYCKVIVIKRPGKDLILSTGIVNKINVFVLYETYNGLIKYEIGAGSNLLVTFTDSGKYQNWSFVKNGDSVKVTYT